MAGAVNSLELWSITFLGKKSSLLNACRSRPLLVAWIFLYIGKNWNTNLTLLTPFHELSRIKCCSMFFNYQIFDFFFTQLSSRISFHISYKITIIVRIVTKLIELSISSSTIYFYQASIMCRLLLISGKWYQLKCHIVLDPHICNEKLRNSWWIPTHTKILRAMA